MTDTVVPLRCPAYTPLDPPGRCQTPGHQGREARVYPGGRLCDRCIEKSRAAYATTGNHRDDHREDTT